MKTAKKIFGVGLSACTVVSCMSFAAGAADEYVYGTMDIPYDLFYAGEIAGAANSYKVDAVSSATNAKWSKNGEGELFEGTYHSEANEDGSGKILGVTYPVAITQAALDALGSDNYNFKKLDSAPAAYKTVTVDGTTASFSAINDSSPETKTGSVSIDANSVWGDYQISVEGFPEDFGAVYGAFITTSDNYIYAMRHEQNIWRQGAIAWSVGFKTEEPHGNKLDHDIYADSQGKTIDKITYITKDGYVTYDVDVYIPKKFEYTAEIANAAVTAGSTNITLTGFPTDYDVQYEIAGLDFTVDGSTLKFSNASAGGYSATISDKSGIYQDIPVSFELTTDAMPAQYNASAKALTAADGASADEFAGFIKNISTVTVDGTEYAAAGKHGLKIVADDGTIDLLAESRGGKAFSDDKTEFEVTVKAAGYTQELRFTLSTAEEEPTDTDEDTDAAEEVSDDMDENIEAVEEETADTADEPVIVSDTDAAISDNNNAPASDNSNPDTGVGTSLVGFILSGAAVIASKKRK